MTPAAYLEGLEPERRHALASVRAQIKRALPHGFVEAIQYGMISFVVPLARFPHTYNGQPLAVLSIAAQKQHMAVYMSGLYGSPALKSWFERAYAATGKRLDMGKSCIRFKRLDDLALDVVADAASKVDVDALIAMHEAAHAPSAKAARRAPTKTVVKEPKQAAVKRTTAKKTTAEKTTAKKKTTAEKKATAEKTTAKKKTTAEKTTAKKTTALR